MKPFLLTVITAAPFFLHVVYTFAIAHFVKIGMLDASTVVALNFYEGLALLVLLILALQLECMNTRKRS